MKQLQGAPLTAPAVGVNALSLWFSPQALTGNKAVMKVHLLQFALACVLLGAARAEPAKDEPWLAGFNGPFPTLGGWAGTEISSTVSLLYQNVSLLLCFMCCCVGGSHVAESSCCAGLGCGLYWQRAG